MSDSRPATPRDMTIGRATVDQIAAWAADGGSAPARLLGAARGFVEWAHYPQPDAIDPQSGWRFYYHCHPASQRPAREHGHFHIFVPGPGTAESGGNGFSHLVGLSVDARGLPWRLFTTNKWVTDETWQPAGTLERHLRAPHLHGAEPRDVAMWLENLVLLFSAEITALLHARDLRLAGGDRLEDHRLQMPSQRRIDLARRLRALETASDQRSPSRPVR
ncbi:MAG: hypothetical protein WB783_20160 [Arenicellales bacterium]